MMSHNHPRTRYSQLEMGSTHSPITSVELDRDHDAQAVVSIAGSYDDSQSLVSTGIDVIPTRDAEEHDAQTPLSIVGKFLRDYGLPLVIMFAAPLLILLAIARLEFHTATNIINNNDAANANSSDKSLNIDCPMVTAYHFDDVIALSASLSPSDVAMDSSNLNIKFYTDKRSSRHLFAGVPKAFVDSGQPLLLVEQVTHGEGLRDLWWDAGKLVTQSAVQFVLSDNFMGPTADTSSNTSSHESLTFDTCTARRSRLFLVSFDSDHRSGTQFGSSDSTNFASSVVAAFDVLDLFNDDDSSINHNYASGSLNTTTTYLIQLDSFAYSKAGLGKSLDLSDAIASSYGRGRVFDIDVDRSSIEFSKCKSNNHVAYIESNLTYRATSLGSLLPAAIVLENGDLPSPGVITVALRRNFIVLTPEDKNSYRPRQFHPKSGFNSMSFMNESADISLPRDEHYLLRFHLQHRVDASDSQEPQLTYLIDPKAPERIRNALMEGIGWWDEAFQQAGFVKGTLVAKVADWSDDPYSLESPRIHFVQWIHRNLRSYSMGSRVVDPRTGQILHGHVVIGSLRMRQDVLLAEALLAQTAWNNSDNVRLSNAVLDAIAQRHRQLGAHEVGHTLGLAHNFAASSVSVSSSPSIGSGYPLSVMDYPPPLLSISNSINASQELEISQASYATGIGAFDVLSIGFGYQEYPEAIDVDTGRFDASLDFLAMQARINAAETDEGYVFLTDQDSGGAGSDWRDVPWNAGSDPLAALERSLVVRGVALARLQNQQALYCTDPRSNLQQVFPIVYLWHRYDIEAVAKLLGGATFSYALQSDHRDYVANSSRKMMVQVTGDIQYRALQMLLTTVNVTVLAIHANLIDMMPPNAFGYAPAVGGSSDRFASRTGSGSFDAGMAFEMISELTLGAIFNRQRIERIVQQSYRDDSLPGLLDVAELASQRIIFEVLEDIFLPSNASFNSQSIYLRQYLEAAAVQVCLVNHFIDLTATSSASSSSSSSSSAAVASLAMFYVESLKVWISEWSKALNSFYLSGYPAIAITDSSRSSRKRSIQYWIAHSASLYKMLDSLQPVEEFANAGVFPMGPPI